MVNIKNEMSFRTILRRLRAVDYNMKLIHFDHRLIIRGQKSDLNLNEKWWSKFTKQRDKSGKPIIVNYYIENTNENLGVNEYDNKLAKIKNQKEKSEFIKKWKPVYSYIRRLSKDVTMKMERNEVGIYISNIDMYFDLSRYRIILETLIEADILKYTPKYYGSMKNKTESIRNQLKRWFKISVYEWCIQVNNSLLGKMIFDDLKEYAKTSKKCVIKPNTIYLQGFNDYKNLPKKIKFYNISAKNRVGEHKEDTDIYKLEITYKRAFFRKNKIEINKLTKQNKIFILLEPFILKDFENTFRKVSKEVRKMVKEYVNASSEKTLFSEIMNVKRVELNTRKEIDKIKNDILELRNKLNEDNKKFIENDKKFIENDKKFIEISKRLAEIERQKPKREFSKNMILDIEKSL